jgi:hypothetical protein
VTVSGVLFSGASSVPAAVAAKVNGRRRRLVKRTGTATCAPGGRMPRGSATSMSMSSVGCTVPG